MGTVKLFKAKLYTVENIRKMNSVTLLKAFKNTSKIRSDYLYERVDYDEKTLLIVFTNRANLRREGFRRGIFV